MEITHDELKKILLKAYEVKMPVDVKGPTGCGKSMTVKDTAIEIAKTKNKGFVEWNECSEEEKKQLLNSEVLKKAFLFVDIRLSQYDLADIRGLPSLSKNYVEWLPNLIWRVISNKDADGIVFFDEMNLSSSAIQAQVYQILNEKQIGELALSKNMLYVSAGNRSCDQAAVFDEAAPLKNRRTNYTLQLPVMDINSMNDWGKWAANHDILPIITGFLYFKPSYLYMFDEESKEPSFPTPRMWAKTSQMIANVQDMDEMKLFVAGTVGEGVAKEFIAFCKLKNKIDLKEMLKNPGLFNKLTELSEKYAVVSGVTELYHIDNKILDDVLGLGKVMAPEFAMFMLRSCKTFAKTDFSAQLFKCKNWVAIAPEYGKYLMSN